MAKPVTAKYPMVELIGNPWRSMGSYGIRIKARPQNQRKFIVFIKVVAFSYSKSVHYPTKGTKDHQNEFVNSYDVLVEEMTYEKEEALAIPKDEVKAVEHKAKPLQAAPPIAAAPLSAPSGFEYLNTEFDSILTEITETRKELVATRKEIEELKSQLFRS